MFVSGCSFSSFTVPMMGDGFALLAQYIRSNLFNDLHCMSGRLWLGYQAMLLPLGRLQAYWLPRSRAQQNQKNKWKNGLWLLDCTREASQITRVQGHALRQTIRMPTELFNWVPGGKNTTGAKKSRWFGRLGILRVLQHVPRQRPSRPVPVLFGECHGSLAGFSSLTQEWYSQACVRKCKGSDKLGLVEQPANRTPF